MARCTDHPDVPTVTRRVRLHRPGEPATIRVARCCAQCGVTLAVGGVIRGAQ